uniref:Ig-like domain-containing protein n=1 Tax=Denticeps clupeoides TaxID=299321 RepID=A0AAY3ZTY2_9TELE
FPVKGLVSLSLQLFLLLAVVHKSLEDTVNAALGGSVALHYGSPAPVGTSSFTWKFRDELIAECSTSGKPKVYEKFRSRLAMDNASMSVNISDLRHQDAGLYTIVVEGERQLPSKTIKLNVLDPIQRVEITHSITWDQVSNSCSVHLLCSASPDQSSTFNWTGVHTATSAWLNVTLWPAEDAATFSCTAANPVSRGAATQTVECNASADPDWYLYHVALPAGGGGGALVVIIAVVERLLVNSSQQFQQEKQEKFTFYFSSAQPQTLYDKVNFVRKTEVNSTYSSSYQEVL